MRIALRSKRALAGRASAEWPADSSGWGLGRCWGSGPLAENKWFFSGLLIGSELKEVIEQAGDRPVILAGARAHSDFYQLALETIGETIAWVRLPAEQVEKATVTAHALFLSGKS